MIKSVQQFYDNGIKKLENIFVEYSTDFTEVTEMVGGVAKSMIELDTAMIAEASVTILGKSIYPKIFPQISQ